MMPLIDLFDHRPLVHLDRLRGVRQHVHVERIERPSQRLRQDLNYC